MNLEKLNHKRKGILEEISAYEELLSGLMRIKSYNRENFTNEEIKVYTNAFEPHFEEITESNVTDIIEKLTNNLLKTSREINYIKMSK